MVRHGGTILTDEHTRAARPVSSPNCLATARNPVLHSFVSLAPGRNNRDGMRTRLSPSWQATHAIGLDPVGPPSATMLILRTKAVDGPPMWPDLIRPCQGRDAESGTVPIEARIPRRVLWPDLWAGHDRDGIIGCETVVLTSTQSLVCPCALRGPRSSSVQTLRIRAGHRQI